MNSQPLLTRRRAMLAAVGGMPALSALVGRASSENGRSWRLAGEFDAPEAKQAAASDDKHVYVVTNERVVKYDRITKRPVAESIGPKVKHLNSAFFRNGRLYLAHSNFPQIPERSEIYRLDVESMKLQPYHDFGNFGGSLTWCVCDDRGFWWCNFAYYGRENRRTVLVKFEDSFKELARWTYPEEALKRIGEMSFSGGIWFGGDLLVSDHDNRRLYRLRVPETGDVLEFLGEESAPLTGQGFAADPKTGGLVGIDRARRKVLLMKPFVAP